MMNNSEKKVVGLIEKITIYGFDKKIDVLAKIDTGATRSSIDLNLTKKLNLGPIIRTKIIRTVEGSSKRPVIKAKIKFSNETITEEFTVADRSKMKYSVLIGLNILEKGFIIDPNYNKNEKN
ncbi:MAG: RimK/LysX family protein [Candidatus Woesearchaeota archaeon]